MYPTIICCLTCRYQKQSTTLIQKHWVHSFKIFLPRTLEALKSFDDEHTESLYSPDAPIIFPHVQKLFPSVLRKTVYPCSFGKAEREPANHKTTSRRKILRQSLTIVSKTKNLEAKNRGSGGRKRVTAHKVITPPIIS